MDSVLKCKISYFNGKKVRFYCPICQPLTVRRKNVCVELELIQILCQVSQLKSPANCNICVGKLCFCVNLWERDNISYLEDIRLLCGELRHFETIIPVPVPADDAPVQQQGLPHHVVPPALLLQQDQGRLPTSGLACEAGTRVYITWQVVESGS